MSGAVMLRNAGFSRMTFLSLLLSRCSQGLGKRESLSDETPGNRLDLEFDQANHADWFSRRDALAQTHHESDQRLVRLLSEEIERERNGQRPAPERVGDRTMVILARPGRTPTRAFFLVKEEIGRLDIIKSDACPWPFQMISTSSFTGLTLFGARLGDTIELIRGTGSRAKFEIVEIR